MNALEQHPDEFRRIVRTALERYTDPDLAAKNERQGDRWEDDVQARIQQRLREALVTDDLEAWVADFNEAYAEVADVFERLRGMMDDESATGAWESMVQELLVEVEYPVATVPDGAAPYLRTRSTTRAGPTWRTRPESTGTGPRSDHSRLLTAAFHPHQWGLIVP
ncbi:hypothetical protein [Natrinema saccharevitans]|uniref:hypothetical protein n=1 Tax=Natrinema saccharevitans TaxID=301967 RepID=UPI001FE6BCC5|nr:hypothetical protein [Natrinema saccharevitans]